MKKIVLTALIGVTTINLINAASPKLSIISADNTAVFKVTGAEVGAFYYIEESPDLAGWSLATTATDVAGTNFTAAVAIPTGQCTHFYRYREFRSSAAISSDQASPSFQLVAAGSTGIVAGTFSILMSGESGFLFRLPLKLTSGSIRDIVSVSLWNGYTKVGEAVFTYSGRAWITLAEPVLIPEGGSKVLSVKFDLANIGPGAPGFSGDVIKVDYNGSETNPDLQALVVGVKSGRRIAMAGSTKSAGIELVRSYPTVALVPLPNNGAADGIVLRFAETANSSWPVSVAKLTAVLVTQNLNINQIGLYAFTDAEYTEPVSGFGAGGELYTTNIAPANSVTVPLYCRRSDGNLGALVIPAGTTRYFEIRGQIAQTGTMALVVTSLLSDGNLPSPTLSRFQELDNQGRNFIWSPNSYTTSTLATGDWTTGYVVPGLAGIVQVRSN